MSVKWFTNHTTKIDKNNCRVAQKEEWLDSESRVREFESHLGCQVSVGE